MANNTDTSAAARPDPEDARLLRAMCLEEFRRAGGDGLTADEVAARLKKSVLSIRPRVTELTKAGFPLTFSRRLPLSTI